MRGAGNDFVVFDGRSGGIELSEEKVRWICDRRTVGCDQLVMIYDSEVADCQIIIYNSDGSIAGACGNATRCVAGLLFEEGSEGKVLIETASGVLECEKAGVIDEMVRKASALVAGLSTGMDQVQRRKSTAA